MIWESKAMTTNEIWDSKVIMQFNFVTQILIVVDELFSSKGL